MDYISNADVKVDGNLKTRIMSHDILSFMNPTSSFIRVFVLQDRLLKADGNLNNSKTKRRNFLLPSNRSKRMASSRRRGRLTKQLVCLGDDDGSLFCVRRMDGRFANCLPPEYRTSRKVRDIIEVC